ncbi:MAG: hypothetical protein ACOCV1_06590 [Bacillota bacterium]
MKKRVLILTIIILFLLTSCTLAFETADSDYWASLDDNEKEIYLRGLNDGLNLYITRDKIYNESNEYSNLEEILTEMKNNNDLLYLDNEMKKELNNYFAKNENKIVFEYFLSDAFEIESSRDINKKENVEKIVEYAGYQTRNFTRYETSPIAEHGRLYIVFNNYSDKVVTGIIYDIQLYDNFGDSLGKERRKIQVNIKPSTRGLGDFINFFPGPNSAYSLIANDTLKVDARVISAVFSDGQIINFEE